MENVLALHLAVSAAAVVPIPDDLFGQLPKAFIQLRPGHQVDTETAVSLLEHVRANLAPFKIPAYLEFVENFPLTPSARVQKQRLLEGDRDQRTGVYDVAANSWR